MNKDWALKLLESADVFYPPDEDQSADTPRMLNMNDTWFWASAWGEEVADDELVEVAELFGDTAMQACSIGRARSTTVCGLSFTTTTAP